jgi:hypothetical protein
MNEVAVASDGIMLLSSFMKIGYLVQKFKAAWWSLKEGKIVKTIRKLKSFYFLGWTDCIHEFAFTCDYSKNLVVTQASLQKNCVTVKRHRSCCYTTYIYWFFCASLETFFGPHIPGLLRRISTRPRQHTRPILHCSRNPPPQKNKF